MSDSQLHRQFRHFSELPYSERVLYTGTLFVLGMGYLFAMIYLFHTYAGKGTGNPMMLSYQDIIVAYSGSGKASRLESALRGSMSTMLPREELNPIVEWVRTGADRTKFESEVRPVINKRCLTCHDGSNPHLPNLDGYDNIKKVTELDTGTPLFTLVRVSHIHLFGMTFIFFLMGYIFSHAYVRPIWFKCAVVGTPFVAIILDISSWYFTKVYHPFAFVVMLGGALNGLCFLFMWVVTMYQMWLSSPPEKVIARMGGDIPAIRMSSAAE
ncbi:MAG: hypothetical protein WA418_07990 [Bradyrhizobium sp.]